MNDIEKFCPEVKTKHNKQKFDPSKIFESLTTETDITISDAKKIVAEVARFIISTNFHILTSPFIREIVCVHLAKNGFERERCQYTRIGMPYYDIKQIMDTDDFTLIYEILDDHVLDEYEAVKKLIEDYE